MKTCVACKENKDFSEFHKDKKNKTGYFGYCKPCRKELDAKYYKNSDKPKRNKEYLAKVVALKRELKEGKSCVYCGENDRVCLDFHHLDPTEKIRNVSAAHGIPGVLSEKDKCELVCSNCHRKLHAGRELVRVV